MMKKVSVVIGRFNAPHIGHFKLFNEAWKNSDYLIICIGSHNAAKSSKNLLSTKEISDLISLYYCNNIHIKFCYIQDDLYSDLAWSLQIEKEVNKTIKLLTNEECSVTLHGHHKDFTSDYLNWFPKWQYKELDSHATEHGIYHATDFRNQVLSFGEYDTTRETYFKHIINKFQPKNIQQAMLNLLLDKCDNGELYWLAEEHNYYKKYKESYSVLPYPPVFVTCDSFVYCKGHILVIKRKNSPGKGLLALAGGFIAQNETVKDGIIRELKEETNIDVSVEVLKKSMQFIRMYDAPTRSLRGRTITHCGFIYLNLKELPKCVADDDAETANWMPIKDIHTKQNLFFEDHHHIITDMIRSLA